MCRANNLSPECLSVNIKAGGTVSGQMYKIQKQTQLQQIREKMIWQRWLLETNSKLRTEKCDISDIGNWKEEDDIYLRHLGDRDWAGGQEGTVVSYSDIQMVKEWSRLMATLCQQSHFREILWSAERVVGVPSTCAHVGVLRVPKARHTRWCPREWRWAWWGCCHFPAKLWSVG